MTSSTRVLDPIDHVSEVLFGLIMVLTFTGSLSVAEAGRDDVRTMLIGALGCNIAWGIIDAAFYLIACLTEAGRNATLLRNVQQSTDPAQSRQILSESLPSKIAEALQPADLDRIGTHVCKIFAQHAQAARFAGAGDIAEIRREQAEPLRRILGQEFAELALHEVADEIVETRRRRAIRRPRPRASAGPDCPARS